MNRISDALELLTAQHEEIDALLAQVTLAEGQDRALVLGALADKLTTHLSAEEELFYPSIGEVAPPQDPHVERDAIKRVIAEMMTREGTASELVIELSTLVHGHTCWQEDVLFQRVAESISAEQLSSLGARLETWSEGSLCIAA